MDIKEEDRSGKSWEIWIDIYTIDTMYKIDGIPRWFSGKESACQCRCMSVWSLGWEDPLEKEMATHSSILAWGIPWTENLAAYSPLGHKESDMTEAT